MSPVGRLYLIEVNLAHFPVKSSGFNSITQLWLFLFYLCISLTHLNACPHTHAQLVGIRGEEAEWTHWVSESKQLSWTWPLTCMAIHLLITSSSSIRKVQCVQAIKCTLDRQTDKPFAMQKNTMFDNIHSLLKDLTWWWLQSIRVYDN